MKMPDDDRVDGDDLDTQAGVCVFAELELVIFVGFNHRMVVLLFCPEFGNGFALGKPL